MAGSHDPQPANPRRAPFQFSLKAMLSVTTMFAVLFAVFRWANLSVWASLLVTLLMVMSLVAGFALVVALARSVDNHEQE